MCESVESFTDPTGQKWFRFRQYEIFYMRHWTSNPTSPDPSNLWDTHVKVGEVMATSLDNIYRYMQAENWSPNGEARPLIERLGLQHTSMSIGDVIRDHFRGTTWMVDEFGFRELKKEKSCAKSLALGSTPTTSST